MYLAPATDAVDPGWTPVAIVTLVIAGLAVLAALGALRQTWRYHPRPVVLVGVSMLSGNNASEAPKWSVGFANNGTADAHDFRVSTRLVRGGSYSVEHAYPVLRPGEDDHLVLDLSEEIPGEEGGFLNSTYALGPVDAKPIRARFTWRQSPNPEKLRTVTIRLADAKVYETL